MDTWRYFKMTLCSSIVETSSSSVLLLSTIKEQTEQAVRKLGTQSLEYTKDVMLLMLRLYKNLVLQQTYMLRRKNVTFN